MYQRIVTLKALAKGCASSWIGTGSPGLRQPWAGTSQRFQRNSYFRRGPRPTGHPGVSCLSRVDRGLDQTSGKRDAPSCSLMDQRRSLASNRLLKNQKHDPRKHTKPHEMDAFIRLRSVISFAAHNAACLAGERPVMGIDCKPM